MATSQQSQSSNLAQDLQSWFKASVKKIIFIHGAWVTPKCWDNFSSFFKRLGYEVYAPAWPFKDRPIDEQRLNPDPRLANLGVKEIVEHYERIIRNEPEPPILIGHSFGGLFVQMLLDRGLGCGGIAIDSAPPAGVFAGYPSSAWSLRLPLMSPFGWKKIFRWPFSHFQYAFVHTLSLADQKKAYDEHIVPETGRIFWQGVLSPFTNTVTINFKNHNRPPLLLIAGEKDRIVPAQINRANFKKYRHSTARTDFKLFPNRVHFIISEPGWEEVAQYCNDWLTTVFPD